MQTNFSKNDRVIFTTANGNETATVVFEFNGVAELKLDNGKIEYCELRYLTKE